MVWMRVTKDEVKEMLDRLEMTVPKNRKNYQQSESIMIPIHDSSKDLRSSMGDLLKKIKALEKRKEERA